MPELHLVKLDHYKWCHARGTLQGIIQDPQCIWMEWAEQVTCC